MQRFFTNKYNRIHLFIQYYRPKDPRRRQELDECLRINIANRQIDVIHVLLEDPADSSLIPDEPRVVITHEQERITYGKWLSLTNQLEHKDISILINSDIYLDHSIKIVRDHADLLENNNIFLALTRYNKRGLELVLNNDPHWCQDTWAVVRPKEPFKRALIQEAGFELGHPGCDNKIAYVMHSYGFNVSNSCIQCRTVHLHADQGRPYDNKNDKLIGLHAFAHPVPEFGLPSKLDFDLLIRHPEDLTEITVNHWINGRKEYRIVGKSPNPKNQPKEKKTISDETLASTQNLIQDDVEKNAVSSAASISSEFLSQNNLVSSLCSIGKKPWQTIKKLDFSFIKKEHIKLDDLKRIEQFTHRFELYADEKNYYWVDVAWPTIAKLPKINAPEGFQKFSKQDKFATGFAYPVFDMSPIKISTVPRHGNDTMFWQYPCITEKDAWQQTMSSASYRTQEGERGIYIGLPWATFIDKEKSHKVSILLIASRIKRVANYLAEHGISLRVHTVCQHILWYKFIHWFKEIGVTDLWISHKELGWDYEEGIHLHPWSLYAVNFRDSERQMGIEIKKIADRKIFACFNGAYMQHYISDVRLKLKTLSKLDGYDISLTDMWHFNEEVYDNQVKNQLYITKPANSDIVRIYNTKLSNSVFSLCPVGAGPNTLRLWESLAIGAIPVVLSDKAELPNLALIAPGIDMDWEDVIIIHPENDLDKLDARLREISQDKLQEMQQNARILYHLVERFSPVGIPSYSNLMPLTFVDQFKSQQVQIEGRTKPIVDGLAVWDRAKIELRKDTESALIHFDQTERVVGAVIEISGQDPKTVVIDLSISTKHLVYTQLNKAYQPIAAISTLWFDENIQYWGIALKVDTKTRILPTQGAKLIVHIITAKNLFSREIIKLDEEAILEAASATNRIRKDDLFDTEKIESGVIISQLKRYAVENKVLHCKRLFSALEPRKYNLIGEALGEGVTMYVHLMNRNQNVEKNILNWLGQKIDELILLDWSSDPPVSSIQGVRNDPRVRIVRVAGQTKFIRSVAQNLATRMARNKCIFKCDSDVAFTGDFFSAHVLKKGEFWVGDWHQARDLNERHLHGEAYYHIDDFERVNGYDERIISYGHDDTNFKDRMVLSGIIKKVFSYNQIYHQPHDNILRATNQDVVHPMVNIFYNRILSKWSSLFSHLNEQMQFRVIVNCGEVIIHCNKILNDKNFNEKAMDEAIYTVARWYGKEADVNIMNRDQRIALIWEKSVE